MPSPPHQRKSKPPPISVPPNPLFPIFYPLSKLPTPLPFIVSLSYGDSQSRILNCERALSQFVPQNRSPRCRAASSRAHPRIRILGSQTSWLSSSSRRNSCQSSIISSVAQSFDLSYLVDFRVFVKIERSTWYSPKTLLFLCGASQALKSKPLVADETMASLSGHICFLLLIAAQVLWKGEDMHPSHMSLGYDQQDIRLDILHAQKVQLDGEIGWPTDSNMNANLQYAQKFNQGFMKHISTG